MAQPYSAGWGGAAGVSNGTPGYGGYSSGVSSYGAPTSNGHYAAPPTTTSAYNSSSMSVSSGRTGGVSPPPASGGGVPPAEPNEWALDHSKQITTEDALSMKKLVVSRAAGSSLTKASQLLNDLGSAWPHNYAICHSLKVGQYYMLAREGIPLSLADMKEAYQKFDGATKGRKYHIRDKGDRQKYPLEQLLMQRLVGQKPAILSVAGQIRRKENGWHSSNHPLVFLFLGSSGIGKTELAKQTAEYMHEGEAEGFIRIDMTEYQHQHEVSKFIGAPPGYAGYDDGGQLTKRLRRCPNAVVLFDEVEKAHPDILTCLLQTFDEGRLTDGKGELVECMDATFVMTSNLGQREIADEAVRARANMPAGTNQAEVISADFREKVIQPLLKAHFKRDEFIGRINEILYFLPFTQLQLQELARAELTKWKETAFQRHKITIIWEEDVEKLLVKAYNLRFGVRSIQHEVERKVVSKLAQAHENDHIDNGTTVKLAASTTNPDDISMYKVEKTDEEDEKKKE